MFVGYARVRGRAEDLSVQLEALRRAGCVCFFTDQASGGDGPRPGLDAALAFLGPRDVLVVRKIDRIGRTPDRLYKLLRDLRAKGAGFKSLRDGIDTTRVAGASRPIFPPW